MISERLIGGKLLMIRIDTLFLTLYRFKFTTYRLLYWISFDYLVEFKNESVYSKQ